MGMGDFNAEATSPCVDSAGGDCDLISSALVIFSVESSRMNVREDSAFRHSRTHCDLGGSEVLLECRKREDDFEQLSARFVCKRASNFFSILSRQIHRSATPTAEGCDSRLQPCDQLRLISA